MRRDLLQSGFMGGLRTPQNYELSMAALVTSRRTILSSSESGKRSTTNLKQEGSSHSCCRFLTLHRTPRPCSAAGRVGIQGCLRLVLDLPVSIPCRVGSLTVGLAAQASALHSAEKVIGHLHEKLLRLTSVCIIALANVVSLRVLPQSRGVQRATSCHLTQLTTCSGRT